MGLRPPLLVCPPTARPCPPHPEGGTHGRPKRAEQWVLTCPPAEAGLGRVKPVPHWSEAWCGVRAPFCPRQSRQPLWKEQRPVHKQTQGEPQAARPKHPMRKWGPAHLQASTGEGPCECRRHPSDPHRTPSHMTLPGSSDTPLRILTHPSQDPQTRPSQDPHTSLSEPTNMPLPGPSHTPFPGPPLTRGPP